MIVLLTLFNSLIMVTGQVIWKLGVLGKDINSFGDLLRLFFSPLILLGICIYAIATFLWIYILNKGDLSYVYPIQSVAFIFGLIAGGVIFKENITLSKIIGVIIICIGVSIIAKK